MIEELDLDVHEEEALPNRKTTTGTQMDNSYYRLLNQAPATYRGNQGRHTTRDWRLPGDREQTSRSSSLDDEY